MKTHELTCGRIGGVCNNCNQFHHINCGCQCHTHFIEPANCIMEVSDEDIQQPIDL